LLAYSLPLPLVACDKAIGHLAAQNQAPPAATASHSAQQNVTICNFNQHIMIQGFIN
jgi:hypothetical protein